MPSPQLRLSDVLLRVEFEAGGGGGGGDVAVGTSSACKRPGKKLARMASSASAWRLTCPRLRVAVLDIDVHFGALANNSAAHLICLPIPDS